MRKAAVATLLVAVAVVPGCSGGSSDGSPPLAGPLPQASPVAVTSAAPSASETSAAEDAVAFAKTFYSIDYRKYNLYADRVVVLSTGTFLNTFQQQRDGARKYVVVNRGMSGVQVLAAAPVRVTSDEAEVVLAVDETVSRQPKLKDPATKVTNRLGLLVHLRSVEGGWLVDSLTTRPAATPTTCTDGATGPQRAQLLADACRATSALLTLAGTGRTAPEDLKAVTTPRFQPTARQAVDAVRPPLGRAPRVLAAGITRATDRTGEVLVLCAPTGSAPGPVRLLVAVERAGDSWLVAGVRQI